MPSYQFRYRHGQSMDMRPYNFQYVFGTNRPTGTVVAITDEDAYKLIQSYLKYRDGVLVSGSISVLERRSLADPPGLVVIPPPLPAIDAPVKPIAVEYHEAMERASKNVRP